MEYIIDLIPNAHLIVVKILFYMRNEWEFIDQIFLEIENTKIISRIISL